MDSTNPCVLYEDLESHRQPALYYLRSDEHPAGPYLICDWNGPPTDYGEFNIDIMSRMIEEQQQLAPRKPLDVSVAGPVRVPTEDDSDKIPATIAPRTTLSHTILTENDGSRLDFLTVPPLVNDLLQKLNKSRLEIKKLKQAAQEAREAREVPMHISQPSPPDSSMATQSSVPSSRSSDEGVIGDISPSPVRTLDYDAKGPIHMDCDRSYDGVKRRGRPKKSTFLKCKSILKRDQLNLQRAEH